MATFDFGPYGTNAPDDQWELAQLMSGQYNRAELEKILEGLRNKPTPPVNMMKERHPGVTPPAPPVQSGPNPQGGLMPVNAPPPTVLPQATSAPPQRTQGMERIQELENYQPGYFEQNAPWIMGLLGGASGLLEAMGPSRMPVSGGQIFARGLQSGLGGYLGGSQFQSQARKGRQSELKNLLDSETFQLNWEAAQDKKQNRENLRQAIPGMVESLQEIGDLSEHEIRRIRMAQTLAPSNPETAFSMLDEIAKRTNRYNFLNVGDGKVVRVDLATGKDTIISGDSDELEKDISTMPYNDIPGNTADERALIALNQARPDSENYKIAYQFFSLPKVSASGQTTILNLDELGHKKPTNIGVETEEEVRIEDASKGKGESDLFFSETLKSGPVTTTRTGKLKPPLQSDRSNYTAIKNSVKIIESALKLMETPDAQDAIGLLDQLKQERMLTEGGQKVRADIADLKSEILKIRSGAAVTVPEEARAKPFLPDIGDSEENVRVKLQRLLNIYGGVISDLENFYTRERGYLPIVNLKGTETGNGGQKKKLSAKERTKELEKKFPDLKNITVEITEEKKGTPWWENLFQEKGF